MTLDTQGVKIESPRSIDIKAGMNLALSAGATLTIGGSVIAVKSDGHLSIESSQIKIASAGTTGIKGALFQNKLNLEKNAFCCTIK
ncbi:MAG: hypothetical protein U5K79_02190 [Cyclobacteriaceae bacterium]|nr:hypothetical protein [Cyclobacteriaceae bacterium]